MFHCCLNFFFLAEIILYFCGVELFLSCIWLNIVENVRWLTIRLKMEPMVVEICLATNLASITHVENVSCCMLDSYRSSSSPIFLVSSKSLSPLSHGWNSKSFDACDSMSSAFFFKYQVFAKTLNYSF